MRDLKPTAALLYRRLRRQDYHGGRRTDLASALAEKRGEVEPADLSGNLPVQLGLVTEDLNSALVRGQFRQVVVDVQRRIRHPVLHWMGATLDGRVEGSGAIFEAKFMLPWSFSTEFAVAKYAPQLQHNIWIVAARGRDSVDHNRGREVGGDQDPR